MSWITLVGACVEANPLMTDIDFGRPDQADSVPAAANISAGLAVIDNNPNQFLHFFSDSVSPNRRGLAVAASGKSAVPVIIAVQPGMPGTNEQWRTVVQADGQIWLQQPGSNKCLTTAMTLQPCGSDPSMAWRLVPLLYSDLARLRNESTGQCLSLSADGTSATLAACSTASVWRFELISATGTGLTGLGYGTAQINARGVISTLGSASMRPCSDKAFSNPSLDALSWVQLTNAGDGNLTINRVDNEALNVPVGNLPPHTAQVFQVPGGSLLSVVSAGNCVGFVDTALVLRINADGSFLAQGGTLHVCSEQATLHSLNSLRPATLRVINQSATTLTLNWLGYTAGAAPTSYGTVGSNGASTLYTFQTHPWMLTAPDGSCRGILTLNGDPQP